MIVLGPVERQHIDLADGTKPSTLGPVDADKMLYSIEVDQRVCVQVTPPERELVEERGRKDMLGRRRGREMTEWRFCALFRTRSVPKSSTGPDTTGREWLIRRTGTDARYSNT